MIRSFGVETIIWEGIAFAAAAFITIRLKVRQQAAHTVCRPLIW